MEIKRESLIKRVYEGLDKLNTPEHDILCSRDPYGNHRDYRIATHDGEYVYISDWYGLAMKSVPPELLSNEELSERLKEL